MLRVGIAGIGSIARVYLGLFAAGKIPGGRVTALSSRNMAHLTGARDAFCTPDTALFTDYEAMLHSGLVDVVMICTPHNRHVPMALQALEAGVHPLIEKPLAVDADEARALLAACKTHPELTAGVLYCRRASAAYQQAKQLAESGALGQLKRTCWLITNLYRTPAYHASEPWRGSWKGEGGGLLLTQASHQLDLLTWLCGVPNEVTALCEFGAERAIQVENDVTLHIRWPGGATGQFIASSREFPGTNRLELSGSKGQLILENDRQFTLRRLAQDERDFAQATTGYFGPIPFTEKRWEAPEEPNEAQQAGIVADFLAAVESHRAPLCPVPDALGSLLATNAAYLSAWQGGTVPVPPPPGAYAAALAKRMEEE